MSFMLERNPAALSDTHSRAERHPCKRRIGVSRRPQLGIGTWTEKSETFSGNDERPVLAKSIRKTYSHGIPVIFLGY